MSPIKLFISLCIVTLSSSFAPAFVSTTRISTHLNVETGNQDYKKVFVAGGSKGVGRSIVDILTSQGKEVVCVVRSDDSVSELSGISGVTAVKGDAFDYKTIEDNMWGCDAVVTTLGGATDDGRRVDYEGNNNVIEAAGILGVTRVVLVTSIGCGDSKEAAPEHVFEALKDVLVDKVGGKWD